MSAGEELPDSVVRATKELIRAEGDASQLLPEEVSALVDNGCTEWEGGRHAARTCWALSLLDRAWNGR